MTAPDACSARNAPKERCGPEFLPQLRGSSTSALCAVGSRKGAGRSREYRRAIAASGLLDGSVDELPPLETLKAVVMAALPPRPAPQQVSTLEDWQVHVEALDARRSSRAQLCRDLANDVPASSLGGEHQRACERCLNDARQIEPRACGVCVPGQFVLPTQLPNARVTP